MKLIDFVKRHEAAILTVIEIAGFGYAIYRTYKDGPKFKQILDDLSISNVPVKEKLRSLAPIAAPAVISAMVGSGAAIAKGCKLQAAENKVVSLTGELTSLGAAYNLSHDLYSKVEKKSREVLGDETVDKIRKEVTVDQIKYDTSNNCIHVVNTGRGNDVFYDDWTGQYFYSDINYIKKVVNDLNAQLNNDMFVSLNEYYCELGLPNVGAGRNIGWPQGYGTIDIRLMADLDDNDKPFTVVSFVNPPKYSYSDRGRW